MLCFFNKKKKKLKKKNGDIIILHLCDKNLDDMIYISWYRVWLTEIGNYVSFLPSYLKTKKKNKKKFWKNEKNCWKYHHLTHTGVPKIIRRCHHFTHVYQKSQSYDVWFLRYGLQQTGFVILGHFLPFYPTNNPKKNFEKKKKTPGDITILHISTKNYGQMMYSSRDIVYDRDRQTEKKTYEDGCFT